MARHDFGNCRCHWQNDFPISRIWISFLFVALTSSLLKRREFCTTIGKYLRIFPSAPKRDKKQSERENNHRKEEAPHFVNGWGRTALQDKMPKTNKRSWNGIVGNWEKGADGSTSTFANLSSTENTEERKCQCRSIRSTRTFKQM
ncbi:hypothetical protein niasHS_014994 [Heterodera schachtii]|uniref:Uncharacterized protein n=1 Tax=Heterodera schachtii TaxID=97005 RepID=A0ABD2I0W0_HETSC